MASKGSGDGCAKGVGGAIIGIFVIVAMVPKEVWIVLGVVAAVALVAWLVPKVTAAVAKSRLEAAQREHAAQLARVAAAKRQLIEKVGQQNALLIQSAQTAVNTVAASEAARSGWLGDVDFTADLAVIAENFGKAHALRKVADELSALDNPSADDRTILAEAQATTENLERAARERVSLIGKCATEATLIDASLRNEREDARTAEQRAQLHARLSGMLYGIEAAPTAESADSTADAVMARVQAYREIKTQIQRIGADGS